MKKNVLPFTLISSLIAITTWSKHLLDSLVKTQQIPIVYFIVIYTFIIVVLIYAFITSNFEIVSSNQIENKVNDIPYECSKYAAQIKRNLIDLDIFSFEHIIDKESTFNGKDIWIITSDLEEDAKSPMIDTIGENLKKSINYTYFITKINGNITSSAKSGREILQTKYKNYFNKNLFFYEIENELFIPEIDVIIYDACSSQRQGYVCVEIGTHEQKSSYFYLNIEQTVLNEIYDVIEACLVKKNSKFSSYIIKSLSQIKKISIGKKTQIVLIWIVTCVSPFLSALAYQKLNSALDFLMIFIFSCSIWLLSNLLLKFLEIRYDKLQSDIKECRKRENEFFPSLSSSGFKATIETEIKTREDNILKEMGLLNQEDLISENELTDISRDKVNQIWVLSDLSWEVTESHFFEEWIDALISMNKKMKINYIILDDDPATQGRLLQFQSIIDKYLDNFTYTSVKKSKHFLQVKISRVIYIVGKSKRAYIQIGNPGKIKFKRITNANMSEGNIAAILGNMKKLKGTNS